MLQEIYMFTFKLYRHNTRHMRPLHFLFLSPQIAAQVDSVFKPYQFKMSEIEGFRYRAKVSHFQTHIYIWGHYKHTFMSEVILNTFMSGVILNTFTSGIISNTFMSGVISNTHLCLKSF